MRKLSARAAAVVLAAAACVGQVAISQSAGAATTCALDVIRNPSNPTLYTVRVDCVLSHPSLQFNSFKLYGDDEWYDDELFGVGRLVDSPYTPPTRVEIRNIDGRRLDEDTNWVGCSNDDELYAKARITRTDGTQFLVTTNTVVGSYCR